MTQALLSLPPSDLRSLAVAVRSGRLNDPYPAPSLERYLNTSVADRVSTELTEMTKMGMSAVALASMLDLLASALASRPGLSDAVDLVTTAPDGWRDANRDTSVVVSELFRKASSSVLVAGYAVHQGQRVFQALAESMRTKPDLSVRMFLDIQRRDGDTSTSSELVRRFLHRFRSSEWPTKAPLSQIHYHPRSLALARQDRAALHAKCVVVDGKDVFVSSANFTEAAQERNVEVGVLVQSRSLAVGITRFFDSLIASGHFRAGDSWRGH